MTFCADDWVLLLQKFAHSEAYHDGDVGDISKEGDEEKQQKFAHSEAYHDGDVGDISKEGMF